jgi:hypothetical protein
MRELVAWCACVCLRESSCVEQKTCTYINELTICVTTVPNDMSSCIVLFMYARWPVLGDVCIIVSDTHEQDPTNNGNDHVRKKEQNSFSFHVIFHHENKF